MPTCNSEEPSVLVHSNGWKNHAHDRLYEHYYRFDKNQFYQGGIFRDCIHGQGTYTWKNKAVYEGGFYSNCKEGYARLSFADNSCFEGLFIKNQPFGPGILTYANGRQDAGFWMGKKLIRLSRAVDYIIPRLAPTSAAKIKLLQFKRILPLNEDFNDSTTDSMKQFDCLRVATYLPLHLQTPYSNLIYDSRSAFFDKQNFEKTYFLNVNELLNSFIKNPTDSENDVRESVEFQEEEEESRGPKEIRVPSHCLCQQDVFVMDYKNLSETDICETGSIKGEAEIGILGHITKLQTEGLEKDEEEFFTNSQDKGEQSEWKYSKILLWNRSEMCKEILKQMFRYRAFEEKLNFNLAKLMLGVRTAFRKTGEKEKQCLQFLKMCAIGPPQAVKDLICSYEISQDLMDSRGNNSLMFAVATDQHDIIDILLDFGVDVNNFNDEGLTPLNFCLLRRLAFANDVSNWETAFLPQEIDKSLFPDDFQEDDFINYQSIPSLDRTFGDGMSVHNSKPILHDKQLLPMLPTPSLLRDSYNTISIKTQDFFDSFNNFDLSQITLFDILRSPKNYSLITLSPEEEMGSLQNGDSFCSFRTIDSSQVVASGEPTPRINIKVVPKTIKTEEFEKSIQKGKADRYLFEFSFKKKPNAEGSLKDKERSAKSSKGKTSKAQERQKEREEEPKEEKMEEIADLELNKKIAEIDKTIEKLLKGGADANTSEVPKPSIHLGVHTKDVNTVYNLLFYGASPDCQLYPNVRDFTHTKFWSMKAEGLLTSLHVIVLQEPHQKNVEICEMLLRFNANPELETTPEFSITEEEKNFLDPECGRTPLHLLCMRPDVEYADSDDNLIKIALMLARVSDKEHFYNGHSYLTLAMLSGNIKLLKALLESKSFDPNGILGKERGTALHVLVSTELQKVTSYDNSIKMCDQLIEKGADPLKKFKHINKLLGTCVDYGYREIQAEKELRKANTSVKKDANKSAKSSKEKTSVRDYLKDHERVVEYLGKIASDMAKNKDTATGCLRKGLKVQNLASDIAKNKETASDSVRRGLKAQNLSSAESSERGSKYDGRKDKNQSQEKRETSPDETEKSERSERKKKVFSGLEKNKTNTLEISEPKSEKNIQNLSETMEYENKKQNERKSKNRREIWDEKDLKGDKKNKEKGISQTSKKENIRTGTKENPKIKEQKKDFSRGNQKSPFEVKQSPCSPGRFEAFPENLRQAFLKLYGSHFNIDVNELLLPYVVLRNGELYYRFDKKSTNQKEQYSLI